MGIVKRIILLERPEKENLEPNEWKDYMCHNTPGNSASVKYIIKIPRSGFGTLEAWIIFVDLLQKVLVGHSVTTGQPMYKCM